MNQHPTRIKILKNLLFAEALTYTRLKHGLEVDNNNFSFHLNDLLADGYVTKIGSLYSLTDVGKEYAGRIDTDRLALTRQAKISVSICCTRGQGATKEFLLYTRLKQPFYGCQGFMTGKVPYGEQILGAALRELTEETGLTGQPEVVELKHYRVYSKTTNTLLEDKCMFLMLVHDPSGELEPNNEGKFEWVPRTQLTTYVTNPFEDIAAFEEQIARIEAFSGKMRFIEVDHWSEKF